MPDPAFRELGDLLTKALVGGDFDLYQSIITLPMKITPRDGKPYVLQDLEDLRADFDIYVAIIRLHGVTDIYREEKGHEQTGPGEMTVHVMTHILVRANRLVDPFPTHFRLQDQGDGWRIVEIESSEGHLNWALGRADVLSGGHFETRRTEE
jgi:hypothetical protein